MRCVALVSALAAVAVLVGGVDAGADARESDVHDPRFVVLYDRPAAAAAAHLAIRAADGEVLRESRAIGLAVVRSGNERFMADVAAAAGIAGVTRDRPIGHVPPPSADPRDEIEAGEPATLGPFADTGVFAAGPVPLPSRWRRSNGTWTR